MGVVSTVPHLSCGDKDFVRFGHSCRVSLIEAHRYFSFPFVPALRHYFYIVHVFSLCVQTPLLVGHFLFKLLPFLHVVYLACIVDDGSVAGTVWKCIALAKWFDRQGHSFLAWCVYA